MEKTEKKGILQKYAKRLENAISREKSVKKELENDKLTLETLEAKKTNGDAFENEIFESYDEWMALLKKQIKVSESTLTNIDFKKIELEAINAYINAD